MAVSARASPLGRYRALLGFPGVRRMVLAGLVARLPLGMAPLAIVLVVRDTGSSYAAAGAVAGAYALLGAATAPVLGRLVDRLGQARVLVPLALAYPAAMGGLATLATADAGPVALAGCAAACGAALPPLAASIRALWPSLLPADELRATAYALEASLQEVFFVVGPLVVALLVALASPTAALIAAGVCGGAGTLALAATPASRAWRGGARASGSRWGALASPAVVTVLGASLAMGSVFGIVEVAMPAFAERHGARAAAGIALAAFSLGSLLGGLVAGALAPARRLGTRYLLALLGFAAGLVPLLLASSIPAVVVLVLLAGVPIAPAFGTAYALVNERALPGTVTEAFAWHTTAVVAGIAVGTAVGGAVIAGAGVTAALAMGAGLGALAPAWAAARRRTL
jgi:MFS family permease